MNTMVLAATNGITSTSCSRKNIQICFASFARRTPQQILLLVTFVFILAFEFQSGVVSWEQVTSRATRRALRGSSTTTASAVASNPLLLSSHRHRLQQQQDEDVNPQEDEEPADVVVVGSNGNILDFVSQSCNDNINAATKEETTSAICMPWTHYFGLSSIHYFLLVIPCGTCIYMDYDQFLLNNNNSNSENIDLILQGGIDIHGKLILNSSIATDMNSNSTTIPTLDLSTPLIVIQGELVMDAANKPINGKELFKITMIGNDDQYFQPFGNNTNACGLGSTCKVGKKAIVVAGGKVTIHGIPSDTPTWLKLYDFVDPITIVVEDSIVNKWAPGAEILLTSHTMEYDGEQVRTIVQISNHTETGYVQLTLNQPIVRPTTVWDHAELAVEVALLSRNIVFEGGPDNTEYHGGHFIVFHTPHIHQYVSGVDIRNFGQQGNLGRYPIHFHFCGNVDGAVVSKNTIRKSNQRCIVVHGTDNLTVAENVAFDTFGHCFILEDGIETGNRFIQNLGAHTIPPINIIPNLGPNGLESDQRCSTFWITNPSNTWIGNVAAGSAESGFWFEPVVRGERAFMFPDLQPRSLPLVLFQNNVAHSNRKIGLRFYPKGYRPDIQATVEGFQAFRNMRGIFVHLSRNINVVKGFFADNRYSLVIDRSDNVDVNDSVFIGISQSYQDLEAQQNALPVCFTGSIAGILHHTWKDNANNNGTSMSNLTFSNFSESSCKQATAITLNNRIKTGEFNLFTTFQAIQFEQVSKKISFCAAESVGVTAFLTDLDGSFDPTMDSGTDIKTISSPLAATLLSNAPSMFAFLDQSNNRCINVPGSCYSYCRGTCFRSVQFSVDPAIAEDYLLRVCATSERGMLGNNIINSTTTTTTSTTTQKCVDFPGYYRSNEPAWSAKDRTFSAYLPTGQYEATFVDGNGNPAWPSFVYMNYEMDELCPTSLQIGDVTLIVPHIEINQCQQLIKNSGSDLSNEYPLFWLYRTGGLELAPRKGVHSSNALTSSTATPSSLSSNNLILQYLDSRCIHLMQNASYLITANVKLLDQWDVAYVCYPDKEICPDGGIEISNDDHRMRLVAKLTDAIDTDGYQRMQGVITIDETLASAEQISLFLRLRRNDLSWLIDNVSMQLIPNAV